MKNQHEDDRREVARDRDPDHGASFCSACARHERHHQYGRYDIGSSRRAASINDPFSAMDHMISTVKRASATAQRIYEVLDIPDEIAGKGTSIVFR